MEKLSQSPNPNSIATVELQDAGLVERDHRFGISHLLTTPGNTPSLHEPAEVAA